MDEFAQQLVAGVVGGPAAFGIAFLGGLVAGFGPCILPMVPAVFGYITGTVAASPGERPAAHAPLRALALTGVFVVGMSLVFSAIGVAAGALGHAILIGRWAYYAVAAVCIVIALQMLGAIELPLDRMNAWLPVRRPETRGVLGSLVFGMLFGLVATPCSTPVLAAIATIAAAGGEPVRGGLLLFVFGLGKGVPLLVLGVASGSLGFMRGISRMMPVLTRVGGVGLLVAAAYLVWIA